VEHDQHQRIPYPGGRFHSRPGTGLYAARRDRICRRRHSPQRARRGRICPPAFLLLQLPHRLLRGDLQDAGGAPDLGAGDARPLPCEKSPLALDAVSHTDGRLFPDGPAALQQRRPDGHRGPCGGPRRDPIPAYELLGRGSLPPLRPRGRDRAAHPADPCRGDRRGEYHRPAGRLLFRRVPDEPNGGGGDGVYRADRPDGRDGRGDRQGIPADGDCRCRLPFPAADRCGRKGHGGRQQICKCRQAGDPRRRHRRADRGGADRAPCGGQAQAGFSGRQAGPGRLEKRLQNGGKRHALLHRSGEGPGHGPGDLRHLPGGLW